jgi:dihydroxyacetone kinase DhaKLM complex PTS-EIIA-like component DhaM
MLESFYIDIVSNMSRQSVFVFAIICAAALLAGSVSASPRKDNSNKSAQSSTYCTICGFLVNIVEGWISSNSTEQELMAFLDKGCSYLGSFTEEVRFFLRFAAPTRFLRFSYEYFIVIF